VDIINGVFDTGIRGWYFSTGTHLGVLSSLISIKKSNSSFRKLIKKTKNVLEKVKHTFRHLSGRNTITT
jgi:hypothetical protein